MQINPLTEEKFNFSKHEKELLQNGVLYIDCEIESKDVKEFIKTELLLIARQNTTFFDEDYSLIQCRRDCLRSIGDLFRITRRYFDITLKEFCEIFWSKATFGCHYCNDIEKRVYWHIKPTKKIFFPYINDGARLDEFNWRLTDVFPKYYRVNLE